MSDPVSTLALIAAALYEVCGILPEFVTESAELERLEVDSLDLVEVAMIVEQNLGVMIDASQFEGATTIGDLVTVFELLRPTDT